MHKTVVFLGMRDTVPRRGRHCCSTRNRLDLVEGRTETLKLCAKNSKTSLFSPNGEEFIIVLSALKR